MMITYCTVLGRGVGWSGLNVHPLASKSEYSRVYKFKRNERWCRKIKRQKICGFILLFRLLAQLIIAKS